MDALHREPRPGLRDFLDFCCRRFERVALFTSMDREYARAALAELCRQGVVPEEFMRRVEYIEWHGRYKDLACIPGAACSEVLLLDDDEGWIQPEQKGQWVPIQEYDPYLVTGEDREFVRIQAILAEKQGVEG